MTDQEYSDRSKSRMRDRGLNYTKFESTEAFLLKCMKWIVVAMIALLVLSVDITLVPK